MKRFYKYHSYSYYTRIDEKFFYHRELYDILGSKRIYRYYKIICRKYASHKRTVFDKDKYNKEKYLIWSFINAKVL